MVDLLPLVGRDGAVEGESHVEQQTDEPSGTWICTFSMLKPYGLEAENIGSIPQRPAWSSLVPQPGFFDIATIQGWPRLGSWMVPMCVLARRAVSSTSLR